MASSLAAQTTGGGVHGVVTGASHRPLAHAAVTATENATGFSRTTLTRNDGSFRFGSLLAGTYDVTAALKGFTTVTKRSVEVRLLQDRAVNIDLKPAKEEEEVTVTAHRHLVETSSSAGAVIGVEEIESLPFSKRRLEEVASLAPGTLLLRGAIAINGGAGRDVAFLADGADIHDDAVGGALEMCGRGSIPAVAVQTRQPRGERGHATGGVVALVTRDGTNEFSGRAYELFRDRHADRRNQFGASLGGPIVADRLHFFLDAERTLRHGSMAIDTHGIEPALDGSEVATPFRQNLLTAKASTDVTAAQFLQLRYGDQSDSGVYGASPLIASTVIPSSRNQAHSLLLGYSWQFAPNALNEIVLQDAHGEHDIGAVASDSVIVFPSGVSTAPDLQVPVRIAERKRQIADDVSWLQTFAGTRHELRAGANFIDEPIVVAGPAGTQSQTTLAADDPAAPVADVTVFAGSFDVKVPLRQTSVYVQDDITVNDHLVVNAGLRYDRWTGLSIDQSANALWQVLSSQSQDHEAYLQDFQNGGGRRVENGAGHWGPRIAFTWDLDGDAENILRAGYGRYFAAPQVAETILFPAAAAQSNYGVAANLHATVPNDVASPTLGTSRSDELSVGYSWQVNPWLGFDGDLAHVRYADLPYRFDANPIDPSTGQRRFPQFGGFRIWMGNGSAKYDGITISGHARFGDRIELRGFYTFSRTTGNVLAGTDDSRLTAAEDQPDLRAVADQTIDPYNPLCAACFGPLDTDARHRVTISGRYRAPLDIDVSGVLRYHSATPYTDWTGYPFDLTPGVNHVNTLRGASFSQIDIRLARTFTVYRHLAVEVIGDVFNLLNSSNAAGFIGDRRSRFFGRPTLFAGDPGQGEKRLAQIGLRIAF